MEKNLFKTKYTQKSAPNISRLSDSKHLGEEIELPILPLNLLLPLPLLVSLLIEEDVSVFSHLVRPVVLELFYNWNPQLCCRKQTFWLFEIVAIKKCCCEHSCSCFLVCSHE